MDFEADLKLPQPVRANQENSVDIREADSENDEYPEIVVEAN